MKSIKEFETEVENFVRMRAGNLTVKRSMDIIELHDAVSNFETQIFWKFSKVCDCEDGSYKYSVDFFVAHGATSPISIEQAQKVYVFYIKTVFIAAAVRETFGKAELFEF